MRSLTQAHNLTLTNWRRQMSMNTARIEIIRARIYLEILRQARWLSTCVRRLPYNVWTLGTIKLGFTILWRPATPFKLATSLNWYGRARQKWAWAWASVVTWALIRCIASGNYFKYAFSEPHFCMTIIFLNKQKPISACGWVFNDTKQILEFRKKFNFNYFKGNIPYSQSYRDNVLPASTVTTVRNCLNLNMNLLSI